MADQTSGQESDAHAGFTLSKVLDKKAAVKFGHCKDLAALLVSAPAAPTHNSQQLTELAHRLWERAQCLRAPINGNITFSAPPFCSKCTCMCNLESFWSLHWLSAWANLSLS